MTNALEAGKYVPKILIADDDPGVVKVLAIRCAKLGFEVQTASSAMQALVMAQQNRPDVLIVDVNMPEVDGLSLCWRLLEPGKKALDVIVVTGKSDSETIERCEGFGATYGHKGPELWNIVQSALIRKFPDMATRTETELSPIRSHVPERSRILMIDDDPDVGIFLGSRLRKAGVDMLFTTDGILGFRVARRERPSVILSDYFMPGGDVNFLLWRLRSTPETEKIPLFVMSGRRLDEPTEANLWKSVCGWPGVARIFRKPFEFQELFDALKRYCPLKG